MSGTRRSVAGVGRREEGMWSGLACVRRRLLKRGGGGTGDSSYYCNRAVGTIDYCAVEFST